RRSARTDSAPQCPSATPWPLRPRVDGTAIRDSARTRLHTRSPRRVLAAVAGNHRLALTVDAVARRRDDRDPWMIRASTPTHSSPRATASRGGIQPREAISTCRFGGTPFAPGRMYYPCLRRLDQWSIGVTVGAELGAHLR